MFIGASSCYKCPRIGVGFTSFETLQNYLLYQQEANVLCMQQFVYVQSNGLMPLVISLGGNLLVTQAKYIDIL